jgi:hypothetical protein
VRIDVRCRMYLGRSGTASATRQRTRTSGTVLGRLIERTQKTAYSSAACGVYGGFLLPAVSGVTSGSSGTGSNRRRIAA